MRIGINPAQVAWSGESSQIVLGSRDGSNVSALAFSFRAFVSPYGQGSGLILLTEPERPAGWPDACNLVMSDNQVLTKWLMERFIVNRPEFDSLPALKATSWQALLFATRRSRLPDGGETQSFQGSAVSVELEWSSVSPPSQVVLPPHQTFAGAHAVYALILGAQMAEIRVGGAKLPGTTARHGVNGSGGYLTHLAKSETWMHGAGQSDNNAA